MNNRLAQQALKQAASRVKTGVQQGAESFVERELAPLRGRVEALERDLETANRRLRQTEDTLSAQVEALTRRVDRLERGTG